MTEPAATAAATTAKAPPPGASWDLPLAEAPLAFLDLEMTGLDPKKDRVLEICIERVVGGVVVDRLHSIVRPEGGEMGNAHVHGIDEKAVAEAPTFADLASRIVTILEGAVLVAHGAWWDVTFMEAEMNRLVHHHAAAPSPSFTIPFYLDTLNLSRRAFGLHKHSLDALREHFGIDAGRAHRADADVIALREVFARCVTALEPTTPRDLWQVRIAEGKVREHVLEQCKEAFSAQKEITLVYRARAKAAEPLRMMITAINEAIEPPRIIGYTLPSRGRRELRADRILRIEDAAVATT